MTEAKIEERSLAPVIVILLVGTIISGLLGYYFAQNSPVTGISDLTVVVAIYFLIPTFVGFLGYLLGWVTKKRAVIYQRPTWEFQTTDFSIDECADLAKQYFKMYNLVPRSNLLYYLLPPLLIVSLTALPLVVAESFPTVAWSVPYIFGIGLATIFWLTMYGAFRASRNAASLDFLPPRFREAIWLARVQRKIPGVSKISIYLDKAEFGEYTIYREPRVVLRIQGIEEIALVKSISEDIGSISRVLAWLRSPDTEKGIVWSWQAQDREFWKQTDNPEDGYYVRRPVKSIKPELDVKDVELVTKNAIAIIVLERIRIYGEDEGLRTLLKELGATDD